ncbi:MAG: DEAD/DEAH box helicase, partial [bacterium]
CSSEDRFPADRELYWHQEKALNLFDKNENFVVATGTGSGKTECFLLPIFKYILQHPGPGVRALLIYPMNALVNDQMERLRTYLADCPQITYGYFTGDTPKTSENKVSNENEFTSRKEIIENPPDILITNYTMLEYMLLRPGEKNIFSIRDEYAWEFVVLDEAHTYRGAQGIEISHLLRRLKSRVGKTKGGAKKNIQAIATSATLADKSKDSARKIAEFASSLFFEPFSTESVIRAKTDAILAEGINRDYYEIEDPVKRYLKLPSVSDIKDDDNSLKKIKRQLGDILDKDFSQIKVNRKEELIYEIFLHNTHMKNIWKSISYQPQEIVKLANKILKNTGSSEKNKIKALTKLIELGNYARKEENIRLLPARYHFMASGLRGIFADITSDNSNSLPWKQLAITTKDLDEKTGYKCQPVELGGCRVCGQIFIRGIRDDKNHLVPTHQGDENIIDEIDETLLTFNKMLDDQKEISFCPTCGIIDNFCNCTTERRTLYLLKDKGEIVGNNEERCPSCGTGVRAGREIQDIIRVPYSNGRGQAAVLAEELYRNLKPSSDQGLEKIREKNDSAFEARDSSPIIGKGRKLLIFTDGRQDAAWFAPYLQETHLDQINRQIIYNVLKNCEFEDLNMSDLSFLLQKKIKNLFDSGELHIPLLRNVRPREEFKEEFFTSRTKINEKTYEILYREFVGTNYRDSIEDSGLIQVGVDLNNDFKALSKGLNKYLSFSEEWAGLAQAILYLIRINGAVENIENIKTYVYNYGYNERAYYLEDKPRKGRKKYNSSPLIGDNMFLRLTEKFLQNKGVNYKQAEEVLKKLVSNLANEKLDILMEPTGRGSGLYQIKASRLIFQSLSQKQKKSINNIEGMLDNPMICSNCRRINYFDLGGICPHNNCKGKMREITDEKMNKIKKQNHYIFNTLERQDDLIELRSAEHTAQLNRDT